jgi:hypothetical protein
MPFSRWKDEGQVLRDTRREEKKDEKINVTFFYSVESSWIVAPVSTWYDLALALTFPITEYWMPPCLPVFGELNSKQEFVNKKTKKYSQG